MRVSEIKRIGKGNRYYIIFDDDKKIVLEAEIIAKHKIKTEQEIGEDELLKILYDNGELSAFDRALTYLEKNIKTEKGIREYLKQKGFLPENIDHAVEKLKEYCYINDESYAENYVKTYASKKGKKLLEYELCLKGVSKEIASKVLQENFDEEVEERACLEILKKYIKNKPFDLKLKQKAYAYLTQKGFSSGVISKAIREEICELE